MSSKKDNTWPEMHLKAVRVALRGQDYMHGGLWQVRCLLSELHLGSGKIGSKGGVDVGTYWEVSLAHIGAWMDIGAWQASMKALKGNFQVSCFGDYMVMPSSKTEYGSMLMREVDQF